MGASLLMTALALVQSGWVVDEVPVVAPPFRAGPAVALDGTWVGSVGTFTPEDAGRWAPPSKYAVFAASTDGGLLQLAEFTSYTEGNDGPGTGFTVQVARDGGYEVMRVRTDPAPELVSLGTFPFRSFAVSCDEALAQCVLLQTNGSATLWTPKALRMLIAGSDTEQHNPGFDAINGAALDPSGRWLALALPGSAALMDLSTGQVTLFRGKTTRTTKTLLAAVDGLSDAESALSRQMENGNWGCLSTPQGWNEGRLVVSHSGPAEVGAEPCPLEPFEYDPKTRKRSAIPSYPWTVLDCPTGGWTSQAGTFVTECIEEIRARMRPPRVWLPDGGGGEPDGADTLPEAVALSPTQIFVMARTHATKWKWFRGKAQKRGGLDFVLNGPSVITFQKNGVTVEEVPAWRFGSAIFQSPLDDDWHLITSERAPALVRLRQDEVTIGR